MFFSLTMLNLHDFCSKISNNPFSAKCIDHYTKLRVINHDASEDKRKEIDPRLEAIVNRMFQRCFDDRRYKQAVGIALETRRIDIFEKAILKSVSKTRQHTLYNSYTCMSNTIF